MACGILVLQHRAEPSPGNGSQSPNRWTAREFLCHLHFKGSFLFFLIKKFLGERISFIENYINSVFNSFVENVIDI